MALDHLGWYPLAKVQGGEVAARPVTANTGRPAPPAGDTKQDLRDGQRSEIPRNNIPPQTKTIEPMTVCLFECECGVLYPPLNPPAPAEGGQGRYTPRRLAALRTPLQGRTEGCKWAVNLKFQGIFI